MTAGTQTRQDEDKGRLFRGIGQVACKVGGGRRNEVRVREEERRGGHI